MGAQKKTLPLITLITVIRMDRKARVHRKGREGRKGDGTAQTRLYKVKRAPEQSKTAALTFFVFLCGDLMR